MTLPGPFHPSSKPDSASGPVPGLNHAGILELARIYVAASAFGASLEVLDRLPVEAWDEEVLLLRAEALLGSGRVQEAEALIGPPMLPPVKGGNESQERITTWHPNGEISTSVVIHLRATSRPAPGKPRRRRTMSRKERLAHWRFLLQLRVLHVTGRYRQVLELGRAFYTRPRMSPSVLTARITTTIAQSMLALRQPAAARALYEEIFSLYQQMRSGEGTADTLLGMANTQLLDCRWDEADALYQEARYRFEEMGQSDKALACLINLGILRAKRGDLDGGRALLNQSLARLSQLGNKRRRPSALLGLAMVEIRSGEFGPARSRLLEVLRTARRMNAPRQRALALELLGEMALAQGRPRRARHCLEHGLRVARAMAPRGDLEFELLRRQAEVAVCDGNLAAARVLAEEALRQSTAYGDIYESAATDRVLAQIDLREGHARQALIRIHAAARTLHRLGETFEAARLEALRVRALDELADVSTCSPAVERPAVRPGSSARPGRVSRRTRFEPPVTEVDRVLRATGWNVAAAAKGLGISRSRLRRYIDRHHMTRPIN